ncbi:MAG: hypothetical protein UT65_C0003G0016 [Parcubacteria group bacterium GW2011_GWF2_39_8b]|nr:MAG: hypothetical protein UT65_C0003G0016 [Parcubacteria group bacterium GW2011_GWF2_39_8b]KKR45241.1 MAG: hypothetical protein UT81_C0018G0003 [Parcubacteria group bacterium GW2011_GWA2_40_14]
MLPDSKDGGGIQDERSECLSPSRGREYFVFYERSEIKNLVTRDRVAASPQKNNPRIFARGLDCVTLSVLIFEVLLQ